jgi:hypothetical protein
MLLFPRFAVDKILVLADPGRRIQPAFDASAERRVWPCGGGGDKAVLDRIEMDVVDMYGKVCFIPDRVLPKSTLSDASLSPLLSDARSFLRWRKPAYELGFDQAPACRNIDMPASPAASHNAHGGYPGPVDVGKYAVDHGSVVVEETALEALRT